MNRYQALLTRIRARHFFFIAPLLVVGLVLLAFAPSSPSTRPLEEAAASTIEPNRTSELSGTDMGLYALIFEAEEQGDTVRGNALMAQLSNRELVGYALATRYLSNSYKASIEELQQWLAHYADHPQAARIARLATQRGLAVSLPKAPAPLRGDGATDHLGRSTMPDRWFSALGYWREGDYKTAQSIFTQLSADESLNDWQHAASYYWAYRANTKLGASAHAKANLQRAAQYPTTFYGLLASAQLGSPSLAAEAPEISDALRGDKRAIRAGLLAELGKTEAAETELRALYTTTPEHHRAGLVTLASELDMPNLQLRFARSAKLSAPEALFAQYPTPYYMVNLHGVVDSALLMAVARNESAFREAVSSEAGATGMMQMLPTTARMVERRVGHEQLQLASASGDMASIAKRLNNPSTSARYGAEYLNMLATMPAVKHNLIHLLVGYNAGPGTLISWKAASRNITDPLLYIESIPYTETRNYVMQVSAQYWIYQLMMEEKPSGLLALAHGQWPTVPRRSL